MKTKDALNILGIGNGQVTQDDIKRAYRVAAFKYHPDRNPAGLEMMQMVNAAYDCLKDFSGEFEEESQTFSEKINAALNAIVGLGLDIEICGCWVWVSGDTKTHKEALKSAGFLWAPKKLSWYFRAEEHRSRRSGAQYSMAQIRERFGSERVKDENTLGGYVAHAQAW